MYVLVQKWWHLRARKLWELNSYCNLKQTNGWCDSGMHTKRNINFYLEYPLKCDYCMSKIQQQHLLHVLWVITIVILFWLWFITYSLSQVNDRIVIMSIHQPRYSIFKLFDTLTMLSLGSIVYHGMPKNTLGYFEKLGECVCVCVCDTTVIWSCWNVWLMFT